MSSVLSQYHLGRAGLRARDAQPTPAPASAPAPAPASGGISAGELSADVLRGIQGKIKSRNDTKRAAELYPSSTVSTPVASAE
jgi:hypothetical protein